MSALDDAYYARVRHGWAVARKELLNKVVRLDREGCISLHLTPEDWQLLHATEPAAVGFVHELNAAIAGHLNAGLTGAELVARCHDAMERLPHRYDALASEGASMLSDVLIYVTGDSGYDRFDGKHYRQWLDAALAAQKVTS